MAQKFSKVVAHQNAVQIGSESLDTNCIAARHIQPGAVVADVGTYGITSNELDTDSVTAAKIAANAVDSSEIASNAVGNDELAASAVTMAKVNYKTASGAVTTAGTPEGVAHGFTTAPTAVIIRTAGGTCWVTTYGATTASVDSETSGTTFSILAIA